MDVSKPAECRNYSLRCTLCPSFLCYPFSFSPSVDLSPIFHPSLPLPPAPFSCSFATRSLPLDTLLLSLSTFCISPIQLRHSQPLCVNSCTYRQRIPTGKGVYTSGNVYLAQCPAIFVSSYSGFRSHAIVFLFFFLQQRSCSHFFSFWNIHVRLRGDFSTILFPKIALGSFFTQELFFPLKKKRKKENFNSNNIQYEERVSIGIMKNSSIGTISPFIRSCSRIDRR